MQVCSRCGINERATYSSGKVNSWCRECHRVSAKDRYKKTPTSIRASFKKRSLVMRDYLWGLKAAAPCADCGLHHHPCQMDFDHVEGKKLFNLSAAFRLGKSIDEVNEEIKKTEIVCSNCHRLRTFLRQQVIHIEKTMSQI